MQSQLSLGLAPAAPTERLFFALMPDAEAIAQIDLRLQELRRTAALGARPLLPQRLHVTLHHLGDFAGVPPSLADAARQAAEAVDMPAFDVAFDQAGSFRGRARQHPLVLCGEAGTQLLRALQARLGTQLARRGLGHDEAFTPHLTLMYDKLQLPMHPVLAVRWRVRDFVLIRSFLGQTRYQLEGRWPLR